MPPKSLTADSAAGVIARFLKRRGVRRVFGLCGGHIMPIWMRIDAEGIALIDVRDERAAVYMAQAHAELTGEVGVALVTAGETFSLSPGDVVTFRGDQRHSYENLDARRSVAYSVVVLAPRS